MAEVFESGARNTLQNTKCNEPVVPIMAVATTFATATRLSGFGRVANGVLRRIF